MKKSLSYTNIHNGYNELLAFFVNDTKKWLHLMLSPFYKAKQRVRINQKNFH